MAARQTYVGHVQVANTGTYLPIDGRWLAKALQPQATHRWTADARARGLRVQLDDPPGAATRTFAMLVDGATVLTTTITGTDTEGIDTGCEPIPEDALVCLVYSTTGNPTATRARISVVVDYLDDNISCYGGGGQITGGGNRNTGLFSSASSWDNTGSILNANIAPVDCVVERLVIDLDDDVPPGESIVVDLELDGGLQGLSLTLDETNPNSNEMDCSVAISAAARVNLKATSSYAVSAALRFGVRVRTVTDGISVMCSRQPTQLPGSLASRFAPFTQGGAAAQVSEERATCWGGLGAFTVQDFYAHIRALNVHVDAVAVTVRNNIANTALTATTPARSPGQSATVADLVNVVTVNPNDLWDVHYLTGNDFFQGLLSWSATQFALAVPGECEDDDEGDDEEPGGGDGDGDEDGDDDEPIGTVTTRQLRRLRRAPHLSAEQYGLFHAYLELDMEVGMGLASGQGSDPQLMLRWSDDGGHTWSNEHWTTAGIEAAFRTRAVWNRLGTARDRIYELVVSDPVKWRIANAVLGLTGTRH